MPDLPTEAWDRAERILDAMGVELVDIEVLGSKRKALVRVTIDTPTGVDLELCAEISDLLGSLFEEVEPVDGDYMLEVSSPGLVRKLKSRRQWVRSVGERVSVKVTGDAGVLRGELVNVDDKLIVVETENGERVEIPLDEIVSAKTVFDWDEIGA